MRIGDLDYPAAIREDHDPFDRLRAAPTFLQVFSFLHWSTLRCPHCRAAFRTDYWSDSVKLGPSAHTCRRCGKIFDDGRREWAQLFGPQKRKYFLPPLAVAAGVAVFLAIIFVPLMLLGDRAFRTIGAVVILVPLLLWGLRLVWVLRSKRRYNADAR